MSRPRLMLVCAVALLAAVLAGCGSSSVHTVTADSYARSICQAVGPFERDVVARSSALSASTLADPVSGKKELISFLTAVSGDAGKALATMAAAGTPNIPNGRTIGGAVLRAFNGLKAAMDRSVAEAQALPTSSRPAFTAAAAKLGSNVRTSMTAIGGGLNGLKAPALEKAAISQPACKSIAAS